MFAAYSAVQLHGHPGEPHGVVIDLEHVPPRFIRCGEPSQAQHEPITLGVELEFQILDPNSLDLVPHAANLYDQLPDPRQQPGGSVPIYFAVVPAFGVWEADHPAPPESLQVPGVPRRWASPPTAYRI